MNMPTHRSLQSRIGFCLFVVSFLIAGCSRLSCTALSRGIDNQPRSVPIRYVKQFKGAVRYSQDDAGDHYRLGRHFQGLRKHSFAIKEFQRAVELDPLRADALNAMGVSYDNLSQFDLAEQHYRWALVLKPDFAAAYNNLGYSYLLQGKPELAIDPLKKAIRLQERNMLFHNNLGLAYEQTGQIEQAVVEFKFTGRDLQKHAAGESSGSAVFLSGEKDFQPARDSKNSKLPLFLNSLTALPSTPKAELTEGEFTTSSGVAGEMGGNAQRAVASQKPEPVWSAPQIEIANGNGVSKMAGNLGRLLLIKGFDVHRLSNADHFAYPRTRIFYSDGQRELACTLSKILFGPDIVCELEAYHRVAGRVEVLIGKDIAGLNQLFSGWLPVRIANGNGVQGMAQKVTGVISAKGFHTVHPVNADRYDYEFTQILYPSDELSNAQFIARELAGNCSGRLVRNDHIGNLIQVTIGRDFNI